MDAQQTVAGLGGADDVGPDGPRPRAEVLDPSRRRTGSVEGLLA